MQEKSIEKYELKVDKVPAKVEIKSTHAEYVPLYILSFPKIEPATMAVLDSIREKMITEDLEIKPIETADPVEMERLKREFYAKSIKAIGSHMPQMKMNDREVLAGLLVQKSLGLGPLEMLVQDPSLEEIVINGSKEPVWVYHRKLGWLKTNLKIGSESEIYNYSAMIGRRVGSQITNLSPLMDAYLTSGDRANATLFPISSAGNTLTIRKFARKPWTITDLINSGTISMEAAAFLWLAVQYEMNAIVAGGTASGKTSMLNVLSYFIPPNHRIISIEDTREIQLPSFLHWVPLTTRPPNPEGKGEVSMLQLMINALRMRPDRMIVGEIRRSGEASVLFEAIHTGHSVYSTLHANNAEEAYKRLTNPPIDIPEAMIGSLQLIVSMNRDRRTEQRRVFQISEVTQGEYGKKEVNLNDVFGWSPNTDKVLPMSKSVRVYDDIQLYTGMSEREIQKDLDEKMGILKWFCKNQMCDVNKIGRTISEYYTDKDNVMKQMKK